MPPAAPVSPAAPAAPADRIGLAVAVILATVLALSLGDALVKALAGGFALGQIFLLRSLLALPLLLWLMRARRVPLWPVALGWVALRSALLVSMWIAYYLALPHLDLSVAAAAYYTLPLFITLFSGLLPGGRVAPLGWFAVALGFAGVLLILRPGPEAFNLWALAPLCAAMLYAAAMLLTRARCRAEPPLTLALWLNLGFILAGITISAASLALPGQGGFLFAPWAALDGPAWAALALMAVALVIGGVGAAFAYQNAPPALIGAFDFAYVGFALLWGLLLFAEAPDAIALSGIALIVLSGLLSLRAGRPATPSPTAPL